VDKYNAAHGGMPSPCVLDIGHPLVAERGSHHVSRRAVGPALDRQTLASRILPTGKRPKNILLSFRELVRLSAVLFFLFPPSSPLGRFVDAGSTAQSTSSTEGPAPPPLMSGNPPGIPPGIPPGMPPAPPAAPW